MKIALFGINMGPLSDPDAAIALAQAAEAAGIESLWAGEHVVLPDPQTPPSPLPPDYPMLDPNICFSLLAGQTQSIRFGTGIIILPQRNPLVLAKELASLDVISAGRITFGIGIGYLKSEFDALGIPFDNKAARTLEYLEAMRAIWTQAAPAYAGSFVSFAGVQARPQPVQKPIPVVFGGHVAGAYRRSVSHANGWYGYGLDLDATAACLDGLRSAANDVDRPAELGPLEISVTPPAGYMNLERAKRYAELGVDRLITVFPRRDGEKLFARVSKQAMLDHVSELGDAIVGRV